ncbi:sulfatase-like hydrolase/transferase [Microbulbifer magnicolonia]|uniref:sulfatase-like hydrolase/transferase n=1 Tax=Microbulbifer magnicolonia TaxID=3109744 RepID=UPI002B408EF3|nr:sulfatase-like hydrolase/transferase [Microbulbifer sp. GG15]
MRYSIKLVYFALLASVLLLPKIILIEFFSDRWVDSSVKSIAAYVLQDLLLVVMMLWLGLGLRIWRPRAALVVCFFLSSLLAVLLLVDLRVRELWLKPLDLSIVSYAIANARDLVSGIDIFFNYGAGFGYTFRYIAFLFFMFYALVFLLGLYLYRSESGSTDSGYSTRGTRSIHGALAVVAVSLVALSLVAERAKYQLNENVIVARPVFLIKHLWSRDQGATNGLPFEQAAIPFSELGYSADTDSRAHGLSNVVVVFLESVRWNSVFGEGADPGRTPNFQRFSREGMTFKSYVSVPHSSKGYYSILTGLHAYPDIEIREAMPIYQDSVIRELSAKKNMEAVAFSSLFLQFENLEGFLRSVGVSDIYAVEDLARSVAGGFAPASSFGGGDELLFSASVPVLKELSEKEKGFFALYFPLAAHYPYSCGDEEPSLDDLGKYEQCIARLDTLLGGMVEEYDKAGILNDTLFVFVGDHGESFGEHGLFIHNSSMYEEEVAVPLVFWAANQQLQVDGWKISHQTDIAPTIADLFDVTDANFKVQGKSLLRENGGRAFFMSTFFGGLASAIVEHPIKYIYEHNTGVVKKFDLLGDPTERQPLDVAEMEAKAVVERVEAYIDYQHARFQPE